MCCTGATTRNESGVNNMAGWSCHIVHYGNRILETREVSPWDGSSGCFDFMKIRVNVN